MAERFVDVDRATPLLLPADLREWVPEDDLAHFVIEAVGLLPMTAFAVNARGTGSRQYPPRMMLALLVYGYANGIFSSRKLERATHRDVAVRYLTGDTHPDHATIAAFRRRNLAAVEAGFVRVLELARELKLLKVGAVSVDGTRLAANASRRRSVCYARAGELVTQLEAEVRALLAQAEAADAAEAAEPPAGLPAELARRGKLKAQLEEAQRRLEAEAAREAEAAAPEFARKQASFRRRKGRGSAPKAPPSVPDPGRQTNLTDPDSRVMRRSGAEGFLQGYNAQLAVDAEGSQLILGAYVTACGADNGELEPMVARATQCAGAAPTAALADKGYVNGAACEALAARGVEPYVAVAAEGRGRRHDFRPSGRPRATPRAHTAPVLVAMAEKLKTEAGRALYARRKQTVEPVFGILKAVLGFTRFSLRGLAKADLEWNLLALAYNCKRLHTLRRQAPEARKKPPAAAAGTLSRVWAWVLGFASVRARPAAA